MKLERFGTFDSMQPLYANNRTGGHCKFAREIDFTVWELRLYLQKVIVSWYSNMFVCI